MPQSTRTETDAIINECKVQDSSLTAQDFYNNFTHAMVKPELMIERKFFTELNSHSAKKGQLESANAINIYLKTHK